ncbi:DUF2156 domain-containing protein [Candidatus Curtissbacteria bacterium]|nr:DUF2156 domain-containing protein [Candidatus Curtissbacteria bacterium]
MIPWFPQFKQLGLTDKENIEWITKQYPPYSDYNFVSLWSWDVKEAAQVAKIHDNLVIRFHDYISGEVFYSFLGTHKAHEVVTMLLDQSRADQISSKLKLIPECVIPSLGSSPSFAIEEDRDNFDYILSVPELMTLSGNKYGPKRNFLNRFKKLHGDKAKIVPLTLTDPSVQREIETLFYRWEEVRGKAREETDNELKTIAKFFRGADQFTLSAIGLVVNGKLSGFSIDEVVHDGYGIIHFEKADTAYVGIFEYLKQQTAIHLGKTGCKYINYEQDLGLEGLRKAKLSYRPVGYLKKYTISAN